jgi:hypothetical protein
MLKKLGLLFKLAAVGTITLFISACYGVAYYWKSITARDTGGNAIPAIKVTLREGNEIVKTAYTDANGVANLDYHDLGLPSALVEDVDGMANGGEFSETTVYPDGIEETEVILTRIQ